MSAKANPSASGGGDPFGPVVGHGRGLSDQTVLSVELQECKDALAKALSELQAARMREDTMQDVLARLTEDLNRETLRQSSAQKLADQAEARATALRVERDKARYAAMRAGARDPAPGESFEPVHQGVWTPGRPFLAYQHAWHPRTGDCYRADKGGAPVGEVPGTGTHWEACIDQQGTCPAPVPLLTDEFEHPLDGEAVRQTELWWDDNHAAFRIREIDEVDDDYLENIIALLRSQARQLYAGETRWGIPFMPCPWNAYASPAAWLADTPLMRALLRERRRRRDAAHRRAARGDTPE